MANLTGIPDDDDALPDTDDSSSGDFFTVNPAGAAGVPTAYTSGAGLAGTTAQPAKSSSYTQQAFERAQKIAATQNRAPTIMDGILAGLGAEQKGGVSSNGATAMLQGLITGFTGGANGRKRKDNTKEAFDREYKLFGMSRQLDNDAQSQSDRSRRTAAYEHSVYGGGGGKPMTTLQRLQAENALGNALKNRRAQLGLDADDQETRTKYKMTPETRAAKEQELRDYETELRKNLPPIGASTPQPNAGTSQPPAPTATPGPNGTSVPTTRPKAQPLPKGWTQQQAVTETEAALARARAAGDEATANAIRERARSWKLPGY